MVFDDYKYERIDIDDFVLKVTDLATKLREETNLEKSIELIDSFNKLNSHYMSMSELVSIRHSIDTCDKFYSAEQDFYDEFSPKASVAINDFHNVLLNHMFLNEFKEKYGTQWFNNMLLENKSFSKDIVTDLAEEARLSNEYEKLLASARIPFDGKINNLSQMNVYSKSLDREIRKEAAYARTKFMESIQDKLDDIYDKLVKVRTNMAKKMGYDNYLEFGYYRLNRSDYNYLDVRKYRDLIYKEVVPLVNKLRDSQRKRLKLDKLKFYDLGMNFIDSNLKPRGDTEELVEKAYQMYSELSSETKEFFYYMISHKLLDLEAKASKMGGGYTTYIPEFKSPFIFSNFNGTSADVDVLTHEAGHAFEVYSASKELSVPDVFWPSLEACEIHSMSMEFFTYPWAEYFFGSDANKYRYVHLVDAINFLPYGAAVDEFQEFVYLNPLCSIDDRNKKWREIELKYMPWKDYDGVTYYESGRFWQIQSHIYCDALYYIDYTIAQICAFNFYLRDRKNHNEAWNSYLNLCKLGGAYSFYELLEKSNQPNPLLGDTLKKTMKELTKVCKKLEKDI